MANLPAGQTVLLVVMVQPLEVMNAIRNNVFKCEVALNNGQNTLY